MDAARTTDRAAGVVGARRTPRRLRELLLALLAALVAIGCGRVARRPPRRPRGEGRARGRERDSDADAFADAEGADGAPPATRPTRSTQSTALATSPTRPSTIVLRAHPPCATLAFLNALFRDFAGTDDGRDDAGDPLWSLLLAAGDTYLRGAFPIYAPNLPKAMQCFRLASVCPDARVADEARLAYLAAPATAADLCDSDLPLLPPDTGRAFCSLAAVRLEKRRGSLSRDEYGARAFLDPAEAPTFEERRRSDAQRRSSSVNSVSSVSTSMGIGMSGGFAVPASSRRSLRSDPQNALDPCVVHLARRALEVPRDQALPRSRRRSSATQSIADVRDALMRHALEDASALRREDRFARLRDLVDALEVMNGLSPEPSRTYPGVSEREALRAVWSKAGAWTDDVRRQAATLLVHQLAACMEDGSVVCSAGKYARIAGAFDGLDRLDAHAPRLVPLWMLKDELAALAARVREDHLATSVFAAVDANAEDRLVQAMRADFADRATRRCRALGMHDDFAAPLVARWSPGFD